MIGKKDVYFRDRKIGSIELKDSKIYVDGSSEVSNLLFIIQENHPDESVEYFWDCLNFRIASPFYSVSDST
jgi:hypothetical protein